MAPSGGMAVNEQTSYSLEMICFSLEEIRHLQKCAIPVSRAQRKITVCICIDISTGNSALRLIEINTSTSGINSFGYIAPGFPIVRGWLCKI
jgi:hypothetical protein